jgi:hypothetical protein
MHVHSYMCACVRECVCERDSFLRYIMCVSMRRSVFCAAHPVTLSRARSLSLFCVSPPTPEREREREREREGRCQGDNWHR